MPDARFDPPTDPSGSRRWSAQAATIVAEGLDAIESDPDLFGVMARMLEPARRALSGVHRYPDPSHSALRGAMATRYGIARDRIALGNGSCDILLAAGEALLEPGAEVIYAWPAFSVYPPLAAASGARAIQVPLDAEDRHDLDAMATEITVATRLVLICNPNNPTSTALPLEAVVELILAASTAAARDMSATST